MLQRKFIPVQKNEFSTDTDVHQYSYKKDNVLKRNGNEGFHRAR